MHSVTYFNGSKEEWSLSTTHEVLKTLTSFDKTCQWLHSDLSVSSSTLVDKIIWTGLSIFPNLRSWIYDIDHKQVKALLIQLKPQLTDFKSKKLFNEAVVGFAKVAPRHTDDLEEFKEIEIGCDRENLCNRINTNEDLLRHIFEYLSFEDSIRIKLVSKNFNQIWISNAKSIFFKKPPSIEIIKKLADYPRVEHLDFSQMSQSLKSTVDDTYIATIAVYLKDVKKLKNLKFQAFNHISSGALDSISQIKDLSGIDLSECNQIRDDSLISLSQLKKLSNLKISACWSINQNGFEQIAKIKSLTDLDLSCNPSVDDNVIETILKSSSKLIRLNLDGCRVTNVGLQFVSEVTTLTYLNLGGYRPGISNTGLGHINKLIHLEVLHLCSSRFIDDTGFSNLSGLKNLQELSIFKCNHLSDVGLESLSNLTALRKLTVADCDILTNKGLLSLGNLKLLKHLYLSCNCAHVNDQGFVFLQQLKDLSYLNLRMAMNITDAFFSHLSSTFKLRTLKLTGSEKITENAFKVLSQLKDLSRFKLLHHTMINNTALQFLSELNQLQEIDLSGCKSVTDSGLISISKMKNIRRVDLGGCNKITDAGIQLLQSLVNLEELGLQACTKITDQSLETIKKFQRLQFLNLSGCESITKEGVLAFKEHKKLVILDIKYNPYIDSVDTDGLYLIRHANAENF